MNRSRNVSGPVLFVAVVATLTAGGCGLGNLADPLAARPKFGSVVQLTVENNDFRDATIYAIWEGKTRRRVGLATGKKTTNFTMEWVSGSVVFEGKFVAGEKFTLGQTEVWEGDHLDLVVMNRGTIQRTR